MQKSAYYCDNCKKIIGDKIHISLGLNKGLSGLALPPDTMINGDEQLYQSKWYVMRVPSGFMHFHLNCIGAYFTKMADKYVSKKLTKVKKDGQKKK